MDSTASTGFIFLTLYCTFVLAFMAFLTFLSWRIFKKSGQSGALGLLTLIPGFGLLIVLCVLAFSKWPIETEVEQHRMMRGGMIPPQTGYPSPQYPQYPMQQQSQYPQQPYPPQY